MKCMKNWFCEKTRISFLLDKITMRWNKRVDPRFAFVRKHLINNHDFSIICNNCWGGFVYRRYGMQYLSPTIGLFIWADDFVRFCKNLKHYLEECTLIFIDYKNSTHKDFYEQIGCQDKPIALLGDIEICFLHYLSSDEAREKWERRVKRVNYNNLIFKFSEMNECTEKELNEFENLQVSKKFAFTSESYRQFQTTIVTQSTGPLIDDTTHYSKYISIEKLINCGNCKGSQMNGKYAVKRK